MKIKYNLFQKFSVKALLCCGLVPFLLVALFLAFKFIGLRNDKANFFLLQEELVKSIKKEALNLFIRKEHGKAEERYVDLELGRLRFLQTEIDSIEDFIKNHPTGINAAMKNRLGFLKSRNNTLRFLEEKQPIYGNFQETVATLQNPMEVDLEDLKKVLVYIEGKPIENYIPPEGLPQSVILNFKIQRKNTEIGNEVFLLNMQLLTREFL